MSPKVVLLSSKLSTTTLTTNNNILSHLNNGCLKLSSVVVNKEYQSE